MELTEAIGLIQNQYLDQENKAIWADLGSGAGLFTYALANILSAGSVIYAIDKSATALRKLPNPNNVRIEHQQLDFITEELHLPPLDGILMANSLHYVRDKITCIDKLSKSLKPNGCFLIVEYDMNDANWWVPYPISYKSLKQLLVQSGYTQVNKLHEIPSKYGRRTIYAAYISREHQPTGNTDKQAK